jgi:IclR family pca regulon transcriptional regulator
MSPRMRTPTHADAVMLTLGEPRYSQSLERGLMILVCFTPDRPRLGIADIAEKIGMSRSTTHRYVTTLVELGYLEQPVGGGHKYRLGSRASDVGMEVLNMLPLRVQGHPYLQELRNQVSHTIGAAIMCDDKVLIVDWLRGFRGYAQLRLDVGPGSRLPIHCTSIGKLLLAYLPGEKRTETIKEFTLEKRTPNTVTKKYVLLSELEKVRRDGFATNDEEFAVGVRSIAMPVFSGDVVIGAVNITTPTSIVGHKHLIDDLGQHLLATTQLISAHITQSSGCEEQP